MPAGDDAAQGADVLGHADLRPVGRARRPEIREPLDALRRRRRRAPPCRRRSPRPGGAPRRRASATRWRRNGARRGSARARAAVALARGRAQRISGVASRRSGPGAPIAPTARRSRARPASRAGWPPTRSGRPGPNAIPMSAMCRRMSAEREENSPRARRETPADLCPQARALRPTARPRRVGELAAQMRLVDGRRGATMRRQPPMVTRAPAAVGAVHHVGHHDVRVQMRVEIAVDPVGERRRRRVPSSARPAAPHPSPSAH